MKAAILILACALASRAMAATSPHPDWRAQNTNYVREAVRVVTNRAPILDHILPPRTTKSLTGEWQIYRQKEHRSQEKVNEWKTVWKYRLEPVDWATAKWGKVELPTYFGPWPNVFHVKRVVELSPEEAAQAVVIKTEKIGKMYYLFVNGEEVAYEPHCMGLEMRHDITKWIRPGKNEIYFRVYQHEEQMFLADRMMGGVREVGLQYPIYLEFKPRVSIEDVFIMPKVTPEKVWTAKVTVTNRTDKAVEVEVAATIEEALGGDASSVGKKEGQIPSPDAGMRRPPVEIPPNASTVVELSFPWKDARLWSPADPYLYDAKFELFGRLGEPPLPKGTADGVSLPKGTADGRVASPRRPSLDAYRQRFGFREISIAGKRALFNGKPFMMRRLTNVPWTREDFQRLRDRGYVGVRLFFPGDPGQEAVPVERICRLADEFGFLITLVPQIGWGSAHRSDIFWPRYEKLLGEMVDRYKNHPSIVCWGVSNEFGYTYGGDIVANKDGRGARAVQNQQKAAKVVADLDPTRPWTACGEGELGFPKGAPGTSPIVSVHYPHPSTDEWCKYPRIGYWLHDGGRSWQGVDKNTKKPVVISEDLYHGMIDSHTGLSKVGGDLIYTIGGYARALHEAIRAFTAGYYAAGVAGWDPWAVNLHRPDNILTEEGRGPLTPDYFIELYPFFANLSAGKPETRALYVYNQWFAPVKGTLVQENRLDGKVISRQEYDLTIDCGARFEKEITIPAPAVNKPTALEVRFRLVGSARSPQRAGLGADGRLGEPTLPKTLAARTFRYNVFPKVDLRVPQGVALVASTNSPLWRFDFPGGKHASVVDAVRSGAARLVVDKTLEMQDPILENFVQAGGFVLLMRDDGWLPAGAVRDRGKPSTKLFRRAEGRMKDAVDDSLRLWHPDPLDTKKGIYSPTLDTVSRTAFRKPAADSLILFDSGYAKGCTHALVMWLYEGKGGWLLNATEARAKFDSEPAARAFVQSLLNELAAEKVNRLNKRLFWATPEAPLVAFLTNENFVAAAKLPAEAKDALLVVDAADKPLTGKQWARLVRHCKAGGDVAIFNMAKETNPKVLDLLKIDWLPWESPDVERPYGARGVIVKNDNGPKFVTRRHNKGMMKGITNDWLFWWDINQMWRWADREVQGLKLPQAPGKAHDPVMNGILAPRADFTGDILTDHPAMAVIRLGKGRLFFSTLRMNAHLETHGARIAPLVRALLNNLGARTSGGTGEKRDFQTVDFSKAMTHALWPNPDYNGSPRAVFGGPADLRYFPVNNCGWSRASKNFCPVEAFPTEPILLGGIPFKIQDPEKNNRRAAVSVAKGKVVRIDLPPKTRIKKLHFLGAFTGNLKSGMAFSFGEMNAARASKNNPVIKFTEKDHVGLFYWGRSTKLTEGKVVWSGVGAGTHPATLYTWSAENPNPQEPVPFIEFAVSDDRTQVGILALTIEN